MDVDTLSIKSPEFVQLENENTTLRTELSKLDDVMARLSRLEEKN